jgi:hypothetical protein
MDCYPKMIIHMALFLGIYGVASVLISIVLFVEVYIGR